MKETHETQNPPQSRRNAGRRGAWKAFTLVCLGAARAAGFTPEAEAVLDILERRIAAAQAGQASRDAFLESLDPDSGCEDWADAENRGPSWRRDKDVLAAIREACPGSPAAGRRDVRPAMAASRGSDRLRLQASGWQTVRPRVVGMPGPEGAASLRSSLAGGEASGGGDGMRSRRAWIRDGGGRWELQAGRLAFAQAEALHPGPAPALPRLDFVSGRGSFPGHSARSGVEGPLEAFAPALDGIGFTARRDGHAAALFGTWNRLDPDEDDAPRRDALSHGLVLAGPAGPLSWAAQLSHQRLEPDSGNPASVLVGGGALSAPWGLRLGAAASGLWPKGGPLDAAADPGSPRGPAETGGYGEAVLSGGKQGSYFLELRQATAGWASPLSGVPAFTRDTLESGWTIPGRGEGGLRIRSRLPLREAPGPAIALAAAGEAAWTVGATRGDADAMDPMLAGDGRLALHVAWKDWRYEAGGGLGWRAPGLHAGGGVRTLSQSLRWRREGLSVGASLSRRMRRGRSPGVEGDASWPGTLETGWSGRGAGSFKLGLSAADIASPGRGLRFGLRQDWSLGSGISLSQSLRLPWEYGGLRKDMGYQLKIGFTGG